MATHFSKGPWTAIEPRTAKTNFTTMFVSNERWTKSRWLPTVIPNAVKTYRLTRSARSG